MSDTSEDDAPDESAEAETKKKSPLKRLLALIAPLLLFGGAGFYTTFSGLAPNPFGDSHAAEKPAPRAPAEAPDIAYLQLEEIVVPLSPRARSRFLMMRAAIEVRSADLPAMQAIEPRILDVLNTYLRAVDEADLEEPSSMPTLRASLLRRVRVVAEPVEPTDLLITAFVLK